MNYKPAVGDLVKLTAKALRYKVNHATTATGTVKSVCPGSPLNCVKVQWHDRAKSCSHQIHIDWIEPAGPPTLKARLAHKARTQELVL